MKIIFTLNLTLMLFTYQINPDFRDFVGINYKPSEAIRRDCKWKYVIVKALINKNNIITAYNIENNVSKELTNTFDFLKGYKFKKLPYNKHSVIFFVSLENQRVDNCDGLPYNKHESAQSIYKRYKLGHVKNKSNTIYIDEIITTVVYDPVN